AGWRRTPYPAYKPKSPRVLGLLKLPVLAASTSLRRSRSPGVQGAAATGRPLCAPCAMSDITQTINRERKLR
ncbi:hypothetical protein, partial [Klebsiella variicola]|uniref:hypothetical protein n=1 Tax=Klebsiella variicola TaxID=244366 RepID=UPI002FFB3D0D